MLAVETNQPSHHPFLTFTRPSSIWRRLSRRVKDRPSVKPPPTVAGAPIVVAPAQPPTAPSRLPQRTQSQKMATPRATEAQVQNKNLVATLQRIDIPPRRTHSMKASHSKPPAQKRITATDMQATPFPRSSRVRTVSWNVFLTPSNVYNLVMGFRPQQMEDKWFIYSEGPDNSGKLKVHFHRSWTGMKIAELFVLIDLKGEGAGKIVGIKWNGSDQTNGMDEEEVKYMISTTCAWVLGVNVDSGYL